MQRYNILFGYYLNQPMVKKTTGSLRKTKSIQQDWKIEDVEDENEFDEIFEWIKDNTSDGSNVSIMITTDIRETYDEKGKKTN